MATFLTEDKITDIFTNHLVSENWEILSRAKGRTPGADIVARLHGKTMCIEAKGGGSQSTHSKRYGQPFKKLDCQKNTDVAFACIPRMIARYNPDYVGVVLPDNQHYFESVSEILPAFKTLGAGLWLVKQEDIIRVLSQPCLQKNRQLK